MAALAGPRNTPRRGDYFFSIEQGAKTAVVLYQHGIGALDASGYVVPGQASTALKRVGRINVSNTGPGYTPGIKLDMTGRSSGASLVKLEFGIFRYGNSSAGDAIAAADVGNDCYIVDDQTVAKTDGTGTRSKAGKIHAVDSQGVWVFMAAG